MDGLTAEIITSDTDIETGVLSRLYDIGLALTSDLDLSQVLQRVLESALSVVDADIATVHTYSAELDRLGSNPFKQMATIGASKPPDQYAPPRPGGQTYLIAHERQPIWSNNARQDSLFKDSPFTQNENIDSVAGIPLAKGDETVGVLYFNYHTPSQITEERLMIMQLFANQAAIAIANARLFETLQEAQEQQLTAERWRVLGQAVMALAHRLNNIIGIIPVCVEELRELVNDDPRIKDNLETIDRNARFVLELADTLLRPFRPSMTGLFDINLLLNQAVSVANIPARIEVTTKYGEDLPKVPTSKLLVDVFVELITNAVRAMPEGGKLEIGSRLREDGWVEVWFTDTGCGITPEVQGRLFELFYTTGEGLGLGLWWVKTLLQQQGGDVNLTWSEVGKGSTFVVELPVES